jgi:hypothetical protein
VEEHDGGDRQCAYAVQRGPVLDVRSLIQFRPYWLHLVQFDLLARRRNRTLRQPPTAENRPLAADRRPFGAGERSIDATGGRLRRRFSDIRTIISTSRIFVGWHLSQTSQPAIFVGWHLSQTSQPAIY